MAQLEVAASFQLAELQAMPKAIRDGSMPITNKPEAVPVIVAEPVAEIRRLFTMRVVKFKDSAGVQHYCQQHEDVDLPLEAASRGLRCGALISLDDPRRKELRGVRGGVPIVKHAALDLDDEIAGRPSHIEPIMRSDPVAQANFTVTEGPSIMGTIQVARV